MPSQPPGGDRLKRVGPHRRDGREGDEPADGVTRAADQAELTSTPDALSSDPVRHVLDNDSEDAHEDHQSRPTYGPAGADDARDRARKARLNLKG